MFEQKIRLVTVSLRISESERKKIRKLAEMNSVKPSQIYRQIIQQYLKEEGEKTT
jgi:predicted transcriptional regulator